MDSTQSDQPDVQDTDRVIDEFSFLIRDKNHDGVLEREEFDEGRSVYDKNADPDRFDRYDTDGDGVVTRDEFLAGREADRVLEVDQAPMGANDIHLGGTGPLGTGPLSERDGED